MKRSSLLGGCAVVGICACTALAAIWTPMTQEQSGVPTQAAKELPPDLEASRDLREAVDSIWAVPTMIQDGLNGNPMTYPEE